MHPANRVNNIVWMGILQKWSGKMGCATVYAACNFTVACQLREQVKTVLGGRSGMILSTAITCNSMEMERQENFITRVTH